MGPQQKWPTPPQLVVDYLTAPARATPLRKVTR
jgi:hypothetical protein